ncbi:hypothetical protein [uncultured Muribaculum sp.]|uniref:hypothetical protein n=1 Tax=uncultured Muribaculum sp. TaxID=1918613 RepID=UPI002618898C|nr:hypothetical protein [uncultured Muribaculum sp.]
MINFKKYSSIENAITRDFMERVVAEMPADLEVVQEKVHGANTSFLCDGNEVRSPYSLMTRSSTISSHW